MYGVVIAGTHSGCGKTTVTLGILAALKKKGLSVQSFKAGPDFIDAGLHKLITGRTSRNLDLYMCGEDYVRDCFQKYSADADISVVEGVMGLYDGKLSTASLAKTLNLPVLLVVDAYRMAESAGAVVRGFASFEGQRGKGAKGQSSKNSDTCVAGVIFNRVASENHFKRLKDSVQDVPVLGYLPRDLDFEIPHRHLGLTVAEEEPISAEGIDRLADAVLKYIDVDEIIKGSGVRGQRSEIKKSHTNHLSPCPLPLAPVIRIAVAYDKAFCFYYEDNLDLLREARADMVFFSPLSDRKIPDNVDALYIGGGYPELYAGQLSENKSMLASVRNFADEGKPIYAECGGFMYLSKGIWTKKRKIDNNPLFPLTKGELKGGCSPFSKGEFYKMAGIFPFETQMKDKLSKLGYREAALKQDSLLGKQGAVVRGHEFHYSEIIKDSDELRVTSYELKDKNDFNPILNYSVKDSTGNYIYDEGYRINNTLGSYIHIHFGSNVMIADNFISFIKEQHGDNYSCRARQS